MSSPPIPSLSEKVIALLRATGSVTDVIGSNPMRAFRMRAPQGTPVPYVILWMPTHNRIGHLRGITDTEYPVVRFDFFGTNFLQLDSLRKEVTNLMTADHGSFSGVYRFGTELFEDDTRYYHLMADFSVWHDMNRP